MPIPVIFRWLGYGFNLCIAVDSFCGFPAYDWFRQAYMYSVNINPWDIIVWDDSRSVCQLMMSAKVEGASTKFPQHDLRPGISEIKRIW